MKRDHQATDPDINPGYTEEEIENEDPLGEEAFAEEGFEDAPDGGPVFGAPSIAEDDSVDKPPAEGGQKVAGVPDEEQHEENTPSEQRPDSSGVVIRERGGASKGDPAVGGTRPD